jgi:hypothetical protein
MLQCWSVLLAFVRFALPLGNELFGRDRWTSGDIPLQEEVRAQERQAVPRRE